MWLKIPGTSTIEINDDLEVRGTQDFSIDSEYITLEMFGKQYTVFLRWLYSFSYFRYPTQQFVTNVTFIHQENNRSLYPWFPRFKTPVYVDYQREIRVSPICPIFATDREGNVYRSRDGSLVAMEKTTSPSYHGHYNVVRFINMSGRRSSIMVHRLVASAWVKNKDPIRNILVNHIDNNGLNNHYKNLEWCTARHNNKEATDTGCRNDNLPVSIRHKDTGEIKEFSSLRDLAKFFNKTLITRHSLNRAIETHFLYDNVWEVRIDNRKAWFYEHQTSLDGDSRRIDTLLEITYPDGKTEVISGGRLLLKKFKLWNLPSCKLECILDMMSVKHPDITVKVLFRKSNKQSILCKDVTTDAITEYESVREASRCTGISRIRIKMVLTHNTPIKIDKYIFKLSNHKTWDAKNIVASVKISVTHKATGVVKTFDSIRQAVSYMGVSKTSIRRMLRSPSDRDEYLVNKQC